jgi:hypothetical protein
MINEGSISKAFRTSANFNLCQFARWTQARDESQMGVVALNFGRTSMANTDASLKAAATKFNGGGTISSTTVPQNFWLRSI